MMKESIQARLQCFTESVLSRRGALVDWPRTKEGLPGLAIIPPEVASILGCGDTLPLWFQGEGDGLGVNLASDFLDRIHPLVEIEPNTCPAQVVSLYLKQSDMTKPVADAFTWHNAKVTVQMSQPARVEYQTWHFQAVLHSEDQWEGVVAVTLNGSSGSQVNLPDPLGWPDLEPWPFSPVGLPATYLQAARCVLAKVEESSASFVARMESRLERDRRRLREYYSALIAEAEHKHERLMHTLIPPEDLEAAKRAVDLELRRKLAEMEERYSLQVELAPVCLVRTDLPTLAIQCKVHRKRAVRIHTLYWNAVTKTLEPMCCVRCGRSTFSVVFTDNEVDALCSACGSHSA